MRALLGLGAAPARACAVRPRAAGEAAGAARVGLSGARIGALRGLVRACGPRALLASGGRGIGIGGLALAMAAKDTLANIFGGVTVFMDKPFRVGDRVRLAGYDGTVEEVGIRSTRIRTLEGPTLVVPNIKFTDTILENVSQEPSRRVRHELGLVCETTPEKLEEAIALLNKLVDDHRSLLEEERLVSFTTFKDFALGIVFIYHIRRGADIFATQNVIHIELMRRFAAAGLLFAYPTQVEISKA